MKILGLYPGLNPAVNDIAHALAYVADMGHEVTIITAKRNPSKGIDQSAAYEEMGGVHIHRPYGRFSHMMWFPQIQARAVEAIVQKSQPDVILCSLEYNMRLAKVIQRKWPVPIVLVVEYASRLAKGTISLGLLVPRLTPLLGMPARGTQFWDWLCRHADAIITYNPADKERLDQLSLHGTPISYVPWCNQLPAGFVMPDIRKPRVIYIGAFSEYKNTDALAWVIPQILESTPTEEALLIGPGDIQVVKKLETDFGDRVQYMKGCSRLEALELIASSFFAFTPMTIGFGGLIGDAWAVQTPVVTIPGNTELCHGVNALIPPAEDQIAATVRRLYTDPRLYKQLQLGGQGYYQRHSAASVGSQIAAVLEKVVNGDARVHQGLG